MKMIRKLLSASLVAIAMTAAFVPQTWAGLISKPYTFSNNTTADANQVNANFDPLYTLVNGNLGTQNLSANSVDTSQIVDNSVNFNKIDWGTGTNQVRGTETTCWRLGQGLSNYVDACSPSLTGNRTWTLQDSSDTFVGRATTDTLTNKTLTAPVLSGTVTGTYNIGGTPTITAPVLSGTATGTYTLAGTPTITSPSISNPVLSGSATGTYTLAGTPTITAPAISSPVLSGTATGTYTLGSPFLTTPALTGAGSGVAVLQYANSSTGRNWTFPDLGADTSVVGLAGAQTITGAKTFSGANTLLIPSAAPSSGAGSVGLDATGNILTVYQNSTATHYAASDIKQYYYEKDDFIGGPNSAVSATTAFGPFGLVPGISGTGAQIIGLSTASVTSAHPGVIQVDSGTTNSGAAGFVQAGASTLTFGGGQWTWEGLIQIPTLSNGTDRFTVRVGFVNSVSGDGTDGVFLRYVDNVNSGKCVMVTRNNSTETATNSTSTPSAATWYHVKIVVNAAGSLATFYVDGSSIGTISTNIPTSRGTSLGASNVKSAGTTSRPFYLDYYQLEYIPTSVR